MLTPLVVEGWGGFFSVAVSFSTSTSFEFFKTKSIIDEKSEPEVEIGHETKLGAVVSLLLYFFFAGVFGLVGSTFGWPLEFAEAKGTLPDVFEIEELLTIEAPVCTRLELSTDIFLDVVESVATVGTTPEIEVRFPISEVRVHTTGLGMTLLGA